MRLRSKLGTGTVVRVSLPRGCGQAQGKDIRGSLGWLALVARQTMPRTPFRTPASATSRAI